MQHRIHCRPLTPFLRALRLIPRDRRWQWLALVPLALVSALLEGLGAGAVMALGTVLADPAQAARLPVLARWAPNVASDSTTLILAIVGGVVAFYLVRGVLLTVFVWIQDTVVQRTAASVAVRLFRAYMNAPYVFHLRRNSARLIQTAGQSVDNTVTYVLGSAVTSRSRASRWSDSWRCSPGRRRGPRRRRGVRAGPAAEPRVVQGRAPQGRRVPLRTKFRPASRTARHAEGLARTRWPPPCACRSRRSSSSPSWWP